MSVLDDPQIAILNVPGLGNSGPAHWQTRWERSHDAIRRADLGLWDQPRRNQWVTALDRAIRDAARPVVLVANALPAPPASPHRGSRGRAPSPTGCAAAGPTGPDRHGGLRHGCVPSGSASAPARYCPAPARSKSRFADRRVRSFTASIILSPVRRPR